MRTIINTRSPLLRTSMHMQIIICAFIYMMLLSCNNKPGNTKKEEEKKESAGTLRHFKGALTGGFKGDSIFFDVNGDKLENLTFKGYWRCDGKMEMLPAAGPEGSFTIIDNKVDDHISEPPNGGSSSWRFDLNATIDGDNAQGKFRMNINGLGCNTGMLNWEAVAE